MFRLQVQTEELKILLALEPTWTVSLNGLEFLLLPSSDISIQDSMIRLGGLRRKIQSLEWLRPNVVRLQTRRQSGSQSDVIVLYPGERLPSTVDLRRRRRAFQAEIGRSLCAYFQSRSIERQSLYSDRRQGIGGAYPRFLIGSRAVITVDPDEASAVVNGLMRAAVLWAPLVKRRVAVVVPGGRLQTIASRLRLMSGMRETFDWLEWDGNAVAAFPADVEEPESHVQDFHQPHAQSEATRILSLAPGLLQAIADIAGNALSIRLRGIEVARIMETGTVYPLGEPLEEVIREVGEARRYRSLHPLARAHEERWLESNLIGDIRTCAAVHRSRAHLSAGAELRGRGT